MGFTVLPVWLAYSPVKNSPDEALAKAKSGNPTHSATSSELEVYERNCRVSLCGTSQSRSEAGPSAWDLGAAWAMFGPAPAAVRGCDRPNAPLAACCAKAA